MKKKWLSLFLIIFSNALIFSGCAKEPLRPEGAFSSAELLADPIYNTPIEVYGQVNGLGEFECPCFALISGDKQIYVWFDMMVEEDGSLNIKADCNMVKGSYILDGSALTIELGPSTMAFCGEESLDLLFLGFLGNIESYAIENEQLVLELKDGAGQMTFNEG